jgi:hypothetical protein
MALTMYLDATTGERLGSAELDDLRRKAHLAYEVNPHIFEDEYEALEALGAVPCPGDPGVPSGVRP